MSNLIRDISKYIYLYLETFLIVFRDIFISN